MTIMKKMGMAVAVSIALLPAFAEAQPPGNKNAGIEFRDYPGNTPSTERDEALRLKGHVKAGQAAYQEYCEACHRPSGGGNRDGSIPQLAGQHSTVVIKQLADIRAGVRYNPTMYPFARKLAGPQALADVAAYIQTLCIPLDSGKYAGPDAAEMVAGGKLLYEKECSQCHQPNGEGLKDKLYPVLAGQHHAYLLRQMTDIRDGKRTNAHPDMAQVAKNYNYDQLLAISAYQASLTAPNSMLMTSGSMCKIATGKKH
jgi:cytochrome c553